MKKIFFYVCFLVVVLAKVASAEQSIGNSLLQKYVQGTEVNFTGLCKDQMLAQYLTEVAQTDPNKLPGENEELAFWLNAYNAYTLKVICDKYPVKSMAQLGFGPLLVSAALGKTVWDKPIAIVNGQKYTLKNIEHTIIRGKFKDPKIQFALYCGAVSCPPLRNEIYEASRLQDQMSDQARIFFSNPRWNSFDLELKKASLSSILKWNAKYFGENRDEILKLISEFAPADVRESLNKEPGSWTVEYNNYDLTINAARNK